MEEVVFELPPGRWLKQGISEWYTWAEAEGHREL